VFQAIANLAGDAAGLITEGVLSLVGRHFRVPTNRWLRFVVSLVAYFAIVIPLSILLFIALIYLLALAFGIELKFG